MAKSAAQRAAESHKRYPERVRARSAVLTAIRSGRLVRPDSCEHCGIFARLEASHDDYDKPLDVEWLCRPCHALKDRPTHCKHGHLFDEETTGIDNRNRRYCRKCKRVANARNYRRRKAEQK